MVNTIKLTGANDFYKHKIAHPNEDQRDMIFGGAGNDTIYGDDETHYDYSLLDAAGNVEHYREVEHPGLPFFLTRAAIRYRPTPADAHEFQDQGGIIYIPHKFIDGLWSSERAIDEFIDGGEGNDRIFGGAGEDWIVGGDHHD